MSEGWASTKAQLVEQFTKKDALADLLDDAPPETSNGYIVSVDLGQVGDYTAIMTFERFGQWPKSEHYKVPQMERVPLGTRYTDIAKSVMGFVLEPPLYGRTLVVLDATGVGLAVMENFQEFKVSVNSEGMLVPDEHGNLEARQFVPIIGISLTGGTEVNEDHPIYKVPKRDVIIKAQTTLLRDEVKFARDLPHLKDLRNEMTHYKVSINKQTGHDSYEAWRERDHDDLVLAMSCGIWAGSERPPLNRNVSSRISPEQARRLASRRKIV